MDRWSWTGIVCIAAACGPKIDMGEDADTTDSGTSPSTTASTSVGTSVGTSAGPGTTATTLDDDAGDVTTFDTWATDATTNPTTGDDGVFIPGVDGGSSWWCEIFAQDCLPGDKCMPWANDGGSQWNATKCVPIDPNPAGVGDPCWVEVAFISGVDNCDGTSMCFFVDPDTNMGTCVPFCQGNWQDPLCEDPSTTCFISNEGVISLCLPACDPLLQDCAVGQSCYPVAVDVDQFACIPDYSGETGTDGDACNAMTPWFCDPGLVCLPTEQLADCVEPQCCTPFCDLGEPPDSQCDTALGETCVAWHDGGQRPPGFDLIGVCRLPP